MTLQCLGSSSSGNCYLLKADDGKVLLLECGVPFLEVKKALGFEIGCIVGCVCSHRHADHSKSARALLACGIRVLALDDVFEIYGVTGNAFAKPVVSGNGYSIGDFKVFCIGVAHDVPCLSFIIEHQEMGRLMFVTDTMMLEYRLPKVQHLMLEANYADDILQENIENGTEPHSLRDRLMGSHMELATTEGILRDNDLESVKEVVLIHLSSRNSDERRFAERIGSVSGKPTFIAKRGFEIELHKDTPY